jgi:MYXO-CTERM domain-containing protein
LGWRDDSAPAFTFYLGKDLSGAYQLSLSPEYRVVGAPSFDELRANVISPQTFIGISAGGKLDFSATPGTDYYVMLSGIVRANETYALSVAAIPEPAVSTLLMGGVALVGFAVRQRRRRISC